MAEVRLVNIAKSYGEVKVVKCMNLDIADGEFMVLVGPSGCGKSTTLRMIAGLEDVDEGDLHIGGRLVNAVEAKDRDIAMVFQNYALYPHMNVFRNMAFGLELRKFPKEEIEKRVREAAEILSLGSLLDRKPKQLSGGQRQRVALGRAIVRQPKVFLFDEPLSNLDAQLRVQMRAELSKLHKKLGCTMVYVTHDQVEAMTMGTRIVVMKSGDVQQVGTPLELYRTPANIFVAGFIGTPAMNFFSAALAAGPSLRHSLLSAPLSGAAFAGMEEGRPLTLGVRPSDIVDMSLGAPAAGMIEFTAAPEVVEILGSTQVAHFSVGGDTFRVELDMRSNPKAGEGMRLGFPVETMHVFDTASGLAVR